MYRLIVWVRKMDSRQDGRINIKVFENEVLRKIFGPAHEDGIWIKHDEKICQISKYLAREVRGHRLRWTGDTLKKNEFYS